MPLSNKLCKKNPVKICSKNGKLKALNFSGKISKFFYPIISLLALSWIVFRVVTKPSRITYPCVKAAFPIASGFIFYVISLIVSTLSILKAKKVYKEGRYLAAVVFAAVGIFSGIHLYSIDERPVIANTIHLDVPNTPIGNGKGIFPGRVVWAHSPDATNENCTLNWNDGYFLPKNSNLNVIEDMIGNSILELTNNLSLKDAWEAMFIHFNENHDKGSIGYTEGEKIFIKINGVGTESINDNYELTRLQDYRMSRTSPQTVLVILKHLIVECGISQENIFVGDPMCYSMREYFDLWHSEFPDVKYIDPRGTMGRTKTIKGDNPAIFYSDRGSILRSGSWADASSGEPVYDDHFYTVIEDSDYMINIAALKAHARAGVTLCAKSHFGSHTREDAKHLHMGLVSPNNGNPTRAGYGKYRIQVDLMGHKLLGGNTMLFMVDGLWGGSEAVDPPCKFQMEPFNNDWPSSIFLSQDQVALESVCLDFLKTEFTQDNPLASWPQYEGADDYLHQAADTSEWPENITYDPENDGIPINSLGIHEHWNNSVEKQYSRNLGKNYGIELIMLDISTAIEANQKIHLSKSQYELIINYPNPFNPSTTISFYLKNAETISLIIYDIRGEIVNILIDKKLQSGQNNVVWNGRDIHNNSVPSGVYLAKITSQNKTRVHKMMLLR